MVKLHISVGVCMLMNQKGTIINTFKTTHAIMLWRSVQVTFYNNIGLQCLAYTWFMHNVASNISI